MQLTPEILLLAYSRGIFPMAAEGGEINWHDPDPRAILPLNDSFHIPRTLARRVRQGRFEIRIDTAFRRLMEECAKPRPDQLRTWISVELIDAYTELHEMGFAHSVEVWRGGQLVGGLYGVAIGGLFAGESMFSREREASKVALVHLTERLRAGGFVLHDIQFVTPHLARFGAQTISRNEYKRRLARALRINAAFADDD